MKERQRSGIRFAVIGDLEPKPRPEFGNFRKAVETINRLNRTQPIDFVAGVGDIPHKGTKIQYEAVTEILRELRVPLYPVLGNEELAADTGRFFEYARQWNDRSDVIRDTRYVKDHDEMRFVFATALRNGIDFTEDELNWIEASLKTTDDRPAVLFVHAPPKNVYPAGKEMTTTNFDRILSIPNLTAVFSGHSHMNPDDVMTEVRDEWGTQHVHVPGIERTKVGDRHVPRFRFVTIDLAGHATVETYNLREDAFEGYHSVAFHADPPLQTTR
jgi:Icc protein